jgi:alpha-mannosidase
MLYADTDRVEIENDFDWHETHMLLKAAFPLRASSDKAAFEIPYGVIERPTTRSNPVDAAKFEVPALRWADLGDDNHGVSLINNSKYGYDATSHLLRLSLLRSSVYPDPDADRGRQRFSFLLYPHAGTWRASLTERHGYEMNYPIEAVQVEQHEGTLGRRHSFACVEDPAVVLTAMKKSEDGTALILRLYDWSGKPSVATIELPGAPQSAAEAGILENITGPSLLIQGKLLHVDMHPYEIKTIRVEYAPARTPSP